VLIIAASSSGSPVSALVWLLIPAFALVGGIAYVVWVSKYQARFERRTERSVNKFKKFQDSFNNGSKSGTSSTSSLDNDAR
jgi:Flp pilus assembly protein TadB